MSVIINGIVDGLVWLINACYAVCHNYWTAIFIFTFLSKALLLPLSVWVQKNSIKTVRMQPEMNHIKASYMGNPEMISEEQYKLCAAGPADGRCGSGKTRNRFDDGAHTDAWHFPAGSCVCGAVGFFYVLCAE